jgi:hypothetical protein
MVKGTCHTEWETDEPDGLPMFHECARAADHDDAHLCWCGEAKLKEAQT